MVTRLCRLIRCQRRAPEPGPCRCETTHRARKDGPGRASPYSPQRCGQGGRSVASPSVRGERRAAEQRRRLEKPQRYLNRIGSGLSKGDFPFQSHPVRTDRTRTIGILCGWQRGESGLGAPAAVLGKTGAHRDVSSFRRLIIKMLKNKVL